MLLLYVIINVIIKYYYNNDKVHLMHDLWDTNVRGFGVTCVTQSTQMTDFDLPKEVDSFHYNTESDFVRLTL